MTELPIYNKIFVILIDLIAIWLAFTVYVNNPKGKLNKTFLWMTVFMFLWVNFAFLARLVGRADLSIAETFLHIAWFVTPLFFTALYFLIIFLLKKEKEYQLVTAGVVIVGISSAFVTGFTHWIVAGTKFVNEILRVVYGPGMIPFLGGIFFIICATLYPLFKSYFKEPAGERKKLEYFIVGALIFYLANLIFNIALPVLYDIARFYFIGDYSAIFLLGFTAYAIITQELFGIRVLLTQALVGVIAVLLLSQALTASSWGDFSWKFAIFLFFIYSGYLLVQSVVKEIKQRTELQRLYEEVDRLSRAKSEFISIASHQLRTPLTAVKGYISMILEGSYGKFSDKAKTPLENVYKSNERLINLVNNLLNISRIESGKMEFEPQISSIEEIVEGVVAELKITAEKKKLYLKWEEAKTPLPKLLLDQDKMRQVILNLVDNAIKYTEKGGITLNTQILNSKLQIQIRDTGEGMEKEELAKTFESFSRGVVGTKLYTEGAGLGLYIARKFVEMHGGKVWAESEGKSKGSTFNIELPIK